MNDSDENITILSCVEKPILGNRKLRRLDKWGPENNQNVKKKK